MPGRTRCDSIGHAADHANGHGWIARDQLLELGFIEEATPGGTTRAKVCMTPSAGEGRNCAEERAFAHFDRDFDIIDFDRHAPA